jgi:hypothetical protein
MSDEERPSTREEVLSLTSTLMKVENPDGSFTRYQIRKVGPDDFIECGASMDIATRVTKGGPSKVNKKDTMEMLKFRESLICTGVTSLHLVMKDPRKAEEGEVAIKLLPEHHREALFLAICEFAGIGRDRKKVDP